MKNKSFSELSFQEQVSFQLMESLIVHHQSSGAVNLLSKNRGLIHALDSTGYTPLLYCVTHGDEEVTEWLLQQGSDLYITAHTDSRPWITAFLDARRSPDSPSSARVATIVYHYQNQIPRDLDDPMEKAEYDEDIKFYKIFMDEASADQKRVFLEKSEALAKDPSARLSPEVLALYRAHNQERALSRKRKESTESKTSSSSVVSEAKPQEAKRGVNVGKGLVGESAREEGVDPCDVDDAEKPRFLSTTGLGAYSTLRYRGRPGVVDGEKTSTRSTVEGFLEAPDRRDSEKQVTGGGSGGSSSEDDVRSVLLGRG